jgi:hypothetical protein
MFSREINKTGWENLKDAATGHHLAKLTRQRVGLSWWICNHPKQCVFNSLAYHTAFFCCAFISFRIRTIQTTNLDLPFFTKFTYVTKLAEICMNLMINKHREKEKRCMLIASSYWSNTWNLSWMFQHLPFSHKCYLYHHETEKSFHLPVLSVLLFNLISD